jgi:nucleoside-diphosphate-sugar epimerase
LQGRRRAPSISPRTARPSYREICAAIARRLDLGEPQPWPFEEAAKELGENSAAYTFGSNSRVRARRARNELGWQPKHSSAIAWIERELPLDL